MSKCFAFSDWVPTLIKSGCINTGAPFNPAWMYAISPPPTFGKLKQTFWLISLNLRCFDLLWPTAMGKFNRPWIICFCVVSGGVWSSSGSAVLGQFPKVFLQGLRFSVGVNSTRCWTTELIRRQRKRTEAGSGWVSYFYLWTTTKSWVERGPQHTI